jgi:gliding motility-associated-like protein
MFGSKFSIVMHTVMQRSFFFRLFIILVVNISWVSVSAQDQTDRNWWFGNGAKGIQFSRPGDTARLVTRSTAGILGYGNAGGAVATDPVSGGLMFYTDGNIVYDATHNPMPDGAGLLGNPSGNQPAVICRLPAPADKNRYYILTNDATSTTPGQIRSTIVDMTLIGNNSFNPNLPAPPLGNVDIIPGKAVDIANLNSESEAMIIIKNPNKTDYWLITQQPGTTTFRVSSITSAGINAPAAGSTPAGTLVAFTATHFAYDSVQSKLLVSPAQQNKNVMVFNFDAVNGTLSFDDDLPNSAVTSPFTTPVIYDAEFSNTANYVYVSRQGDTGTPGVLLQFNRANLIVSVDTIKVPNMVRSYGLRLAPDSSIYHIYQTAVNGPFRVGRITDPDTVANLANYEPLPFGNIDFASKQFPSFLVAQPPVITLDFDYAGTCANSPTTFFPTVDPAADSLHWDFGDGGGVVNAWSPSHTYTQGQTFPVKLTAYLDGDSATVSKDVTITQFDLQLTLVQDTTACSCELKFPKSTTAGKTYPNGSACNNFTLTAQAQGTPGSIQWFGPSGALAGMNTLSLTSVDSAGFYYVIAQDASGTPGCQAYAGVNIREYAVQDPRANIWHFGNGAGLNFNQDFIPATGVDPIPGPATSAEGIATISDQNGQVILTTNGEQVWNHDGTALLPIPPGLEGSQNATQSAFIIPVPGDPTLYYIFVTQEVYPPVAPGYELRYVIYDLKANLGQGGVIDPDNDPSNGVTQVLFTKSTERITGNDNWLIAHEYGNNNFRAYQVTQQGLSAPVISSIGSDHSLAVAENAQGYMKLSGNLLAVALSTPGVSNVVEIFDFDLTSGAVTNFRQVDLNQPAGQVYGIQISGTKLFATTKFSTQAPGASMLYEFAYDSTVGNFISKAAITPQAATGELGAIERGPDGTTYVAVNGSGSLGTIAANQNVDQPSTFKENGQPLSPTVPPGATPTSTLGLPNFIQNIADLAQTPTIAVSGTCEDFPTDFTGSGTDPIDTLTWDFGDGQSQKGANLTSVTHTYSDPGDYTVILRISNRCVGPIDSLTQIRTVTISPQPTVFTGVLELCNGTETMHATDSPETGMTYQWTTGDTTNVVKPPPGNGDYTVTVTSAAGCVNTGETFVVDNRPQVELGPDQTLCEDTGNITLDAQNVSQDITYSWTRNGATFAGSQSQVVVVSTNNPFPAREYKVTLNDSFTGCTITDSVTLVVNPAPAFTPTTIPPSACTVKDGQINLQITTSGVYTYTASGRTGTFTGSDENGPKTINIPGLQAGAYNVIVADQVSGCQDQRTVALSDQAFTTEIERVGTCNDANGQLPVLIKNTPNQATFTYDLLLNGTQPPVASGNQSNNPTEPVNNGNYVVEVTAANCIAVSNTTSITQDPTVRLTVDIDECANPITLEAVLDNPAPANPTFTWTGTGITTPLTTAEIKPPSPNGLNTFRLIVTGTGVCAEDTTFTVNVEKDLKPLISQTDACQDDVFLSASPTGNYVYRWFRNNSGTQLPAGGQQIQVTQADDGMNYRVEMRNTNTGCKLTTDTVVAVLGLLTIEIDNPLACKGTPYTLTSTTNQTPDNLFWELDHKLLTGENSPTLVVSDDREGLFRVTAERTSADASKTCVARDSVSIVVSPVTPGTLPDEGIICPDPSANAETNLKTVTLDPGSGFKTYTWYKDGHLQDETTPTFVATDVGEYRVELVNIFNCPSEDHIVLREECDPQISGPNAFRPDGTNKEFFLYTFFIDETSFEIYIFNRWGEMIFYDNDPDFKWNGGYKNNINQPLPPGTYSYLVKYKSSYRPERGTEEYRGGVVLLR